jgi:ATP-binding cassette subfamily F protein uup
LARLQVQNLDQDVTTMSGGERRRVALARLLVSSPDLAILDEPTNHLDADTIEWLETYLRETFSGALLLITHDRYVLERVAERTLELAQGKIYSYDGGWERYLEAKAERMEFEARTEANRQNFLRRELVWLQRQPKARTTKQKARISRAESALAVAGPVAERSLQFETASGRLGSTILEFAELRLEIADKLLIDGLTLKLTAGERLGIIGKNGSGKSSLLRAIAGDLAPAHGQLVLGKNTAPAYFDQTRSGLVDDENILQNVAGNADSVKLGERSLSVYNYLERFSFQGDRLRTPVGALSGGERARVALAKLLLVQGNLLMLDEPTNDLDVQTLSALEEMLLEFKGVTLVVTHDRYFLNRVATSILAFEGNGKVTRYAGNFDDYLLQRSEAEARAKEDAIKAPSVKITKKPKRGLTHAEKRELETLMPRIEALETEISDLEKALADPKTYEGGGEEIRKLNTAIEAARATLETTMARWEELELKQAQENA